jgi:hypothetical protein
LRDCASGLTSAAGLAHQNKSGPKAQGMNPKAWPSAMLQGMQTILHSQVGRNANSLFDLSSPIGPRRFLQNFFLQKRSNGELSST